MEGSNGMSEFVDSIISSVTDAVSLADVALIVGAIISAGAVFIITWKFARKGFAFVMNALSGRGGKI